jgi:hypothetical protein
MVEGHVFQYGCVAWYSGEPLCQFSWSLSGFYIMPKEVFAWIFCAQWYWFVRPWNLTVPVEIVVCVVYFFG